MIIDSHSEHLNQAKPPRCPVANLSNLTRQQSSDVKPRVSGTDRSENTECISNKTTERLTHRPATVYRRRILCATDDVRHAHAASVHVRYNWVSAARRGSSAARFPQATNFAITQNRAGRQVTVPEARGFRALNDAVHGNSAAVRPISRPAKVWQTQA